MLRVMHVLNTGKYSGAENVVITLINSTKSDVESIYVSLEGNIVEYLNESNIHYEPIKKITVFEIRRIIKKVNPSIIHAHDFTAGIICSIATDLPIINHIHNNSPWIKRYNIRSFVYALSCFRYKRILTVSDSVMKEYVFGRWFKNITKVVGNPVDIDKVIRFAGEKNIKYDIAFLGRISLQKNPFLFVDIIMRVKAIRKDINVIMIGDGDLRLEIESELKKKGLNRFVTLVGFQKNPYKYLNQAKILLMPSAWEGYGLAAVEAMALGMPVVCSNVGGLPFIVNTNCGRICENLSEYSDSIVELLDNEALYNRCSKAAKARAKEIGGINTYSRSVLNVYNEVL